MSPLEKSKCQNAESMLFLEPKKKKKKKLKWREEGHEGCDKMTKEEKTEAKSRNSEKH